MKKIILLSTVLFNIACNAPNKKPAEILASQPKQEVKNKYAFDVANENDCLNFLKGKTFYGNAIRIEINNDGKVSMYKKTDNNLLFESDFGKQPEIGIRYGAGGRRIKIAGTTSYRMGGAVEVQKDSVVELVAINNGTLTTKSGEETFTLTH
ncbi:MAG: hypothetical protein ACXVDZ_17035 [Bacteroidia bacterium]